MKTHRTFSHAARQERGVYAASSFGSCGSIVSFWSFGRRSGLKAALRGQCQVAPVRRAGGFTMIEIAISLAVIAFALVAIIGILPTGLQISKDSREESIINQDGAYLLEALRNGAQGMVDLSYFCDDVSSNVFGSGPNPPSDQIISQLSAPGTHVAVFRAINGPAANRVADKDLAFRYEVTVEVQKVNSISPDVVASQPQIVNNLYDVRMVLRWPLVPAPTASGLGPSSRATRRVFRTFISGLRVTNTPQPYFDQSQFQTQ